jgi:hypothetical protein
MALLWKDALCPGLWHLRDGRTFECRDADIPHFYQTLHDMHAAGLNIPFAWEHQKHAVPLSTHDLFTDTSKHCFAHLAGVRMAPGNVIEVALDDAEADPEDLRQFAKTKFVSPYIEPSPYTDDTGRTWPAWSIMHIAATPQPINRNQRPFRLPASAPAPAGVGMSAGPRGLRQQFARAKPVGLRSSGRHAAICMSGATLGALEMSGSQPGTRSEAVKKSWETRHAHGEGKGRTSAHESDHMVMYHRGNQQSNEGKAKYHRGEQERHIAEGAASRKAAQHNTDHGFHAVAAEHETKANASYSRASEHKRAADKHEAAAAEHKASADAIVKALKSGKVRHPATGELVDKKQIAMSTGAEFEEPMANENEDVVVPSEDDGGADTGLDAGKIDEAIACMAKLGLHVGEATTADNFIDQLIAACKTKEAHENEGGEEEGADQEGTEGNSEEVTTASSPVMMSTMQANLATVTKERDALKTERDALKAEVTRERSARAKTHEDGLKRDIKVLQDTGRITPQIATDLRMRLRTEPVALSAAGAVVESSVVAAVRAYQKLPPNASWPAISMSAMADEQESTAEDLFPLGGEQDAKKDREKQEAIGEEIATMVMGGPAKAGAGK